MRLEITPTEQKRFRQTVVAAMRATITELAATSNAEEASPATQSLQSLAIMYQESFKGFIHSDWKAITENIFLMKDRVSPATVFDEPKKTAKKSRR